MSDSVVIYRSFVEASKSLAPEEFKECWMSIFEYALNDTEPEDIESPLAEAILIMAKPQIDANKKRKADGSKGGAPKGNKNAKKQPVVESKNNHRLNAKQPNVNVNVNENVNVNVNVNDNPLLYPSNIQEVEEECRKEHLTLVNPSQFFSYYSNNGWKDKEGEPIRDWQLVIKAWEIRAKEKPSRPAYKDFKQREYDFEELEKLIIANG